MLQFKIKEILIGRGIVQPYTWLLKKGNFSQNKATRLLHQKVASITLLDLSKLCVLLGCTPNDLLYWQQDKKYNLDDDHPCMQQLQEPHDAEQWETVLQKLKTADVLALHQQLSAKSDDALDKKEKEKVKQNENE